jgi:hypothetical protein
MEFSMKYQKLSSAGAIAAPLKLRESPATRDIPVFLTAPSDARDEEHRLGLDAADYIQRYGSMIRSAAAHWRKIAEETHEHAARN